MYEKITGENPYEVPMRIYPAVHYTMGGLWVDYELMSNLDGLYVLGEANFSDHGANRLGASALMQGLADGYFVIPYTIGNYLAGEIRNPLVPTSHEAFDEAEKKVSDRISQLMNIKGSQSVESFHKRLGKIIWDKCGMARNAQGLQEAIKEVRQLKEEFWKDVRIPGDINEFNPELDKAQRVADFIELGELMCIDALHRNESAGGHFREEYQTPDGEALRQDDQFMYVAAWEYKVAVEELARIDSSVCITMAAHTSLGTMPIYLWGTDEQKESGCRCSAAGEQLASFGLTEPEAGSDAGNVRTHGEARRRRVGRSTAPSSSSPTRAPTSPAASRSPRSPARRRAQGDLQPDRPHRHPRLRGRRALPQDGLERLRHAPLSFDGCRVPEANLLGRRGDGFKNFLHILDGGRIGVAAMGVGLAQGALDEAISYAKERRAFGQAISKFQSIQAKIADLSAQIEAARLLTWRAALEKDARRVVHPDRRPGEADHRPPRGARHRGGGADPRRLRLHRGVPGLPLLPRRQDPHHRRGHRRGAADGDRPPARLLSCSGRSRRVGR